MKQHFNNEYMSPKTKNSVKKLQQIPEQAHTYAAKKKGSEKLKKEKSQNPSESHSIVKEKQKTSRMAQKIADEKQASRKRAAQRSPLQGTKKTSQLGDVYRKA